MYRGGLGSKNDLELQITKLFPDVALFLEKPVATGVPWEKSVEEAKIVGAKMEKEHKGPISIGYVVSDHPISLDVHTHVLGSARTSRRVGTHADLRDVQILLEIPACRSGDEEIDQGEQLDYVSLISVVTRLGSWRSDIVHTVWLSMLDISWLTSLLPKL